MPGITVLLTDNELIKQFLDEGDQSAFETLVRRHSVTVWNVCKNILWQREDAEDAFQAVFLLLSIKASKLQTHRSVGGWIHGTAVRTCLNLRRKICRMREVAMAGESFNEFPEVEKEPWQRISQVSEIELLHSEITKLPKRYREAIVLFHFEGKSRQEAASLLGCTTASIKGLLTRARKSLRNRLIRRGVSASSLLCETESELQQLQRRDDSQNETTSTENATGLLVGLSVIQPSEQLIVSTLQKCQGIEQIIAVGTTGEVVQSLVQKELVTMPMPVSTIAMTGCLIVAAFASTLFGLTNVPEPDHPSNPFAGRSSLVELEVMDGEFVPKAVQSNFVSVDNRVFEAMGETLESQFVVASNRQQADQQENELSDESKSGNQKADVVYKQILREYEGQAQLSTFKWLRPKQPDAEIDEVENTSRVRAFRKSTGENGLEAYDPRTGNVLRQFSDTNGDKKLDSWSFFKDGVETYRDSDTNFDHKADEHRYFTKDNVRVLVDEDQDGKPDQETTQLRKPKPREIVKDVPQMSRSGAGLLNGDMEAGELGDLPTGWYKPSVKAGAISLAQDSDSNSKVCLIESEDADAFTNLLQSVSVRHLIGKRVQLRAKIRSEVVDNGRAQMWMRVDSRGGSIFLDNMSDRPIRNPEWEVYEMVADIKPGATGIVLGVFLNGKGKCWVDDVSLEVVNQSVPTTRNLKEGATAAAPARQRPKFDIGEQHPGTYHVTSSAVVTMVRKRDEKDGPATMLLPLPLSYRDQVPIACEFKVDPESAIESITIEKDKLENYVARLVLKEEAKKIQVGFEATVLVGPSNFDLAGEPIAIPEQWPEEARPWLNATWCVGSDHERIVAIGRKITKETDDVLEIIKRVESEAREIFRNSSGRVENLTAVEALDKRGSCTSCGNLVAALLRSSNVPARVLAGYPSWSGPLQTHYIVEAYVPGYGWYPIESTMLRSPWPNSHQVNVAVIPIEYEAEECAGRRTNIAGGVPYLSLTESSGRPILKMGNVPGAKYCDHVSTLAGEIEADREAWAKKLDAAKLKWKEWLNARSEPSNKNPRYGESGHLSKFRSLDEVKVGEGS